MTNEECRWMFQQLRQTMNDSGLSWIVTQVEEEIRFGRTSIKRIPARVEPADELAIEGLTEGARVAKVRVSATRPYTPKEQLGILLDALDRTVGGINDMEEAVRRYLAERSGPWDSVHCIRTDEANPHPVTINRIADPKRSENVDELRRLMRTLREMI